MANNAKNIDDAINKIFKNYTASLKEAVRYASDKAVEDVYRYSMTCLDEYYEAYSPNSYDRTYTLWQAILPYIHIDSNKDIITSTVGVKYDAAILDVRAQDIYEGSSKYGQPDGAWILENYLKGIHPATNGERIPEKVAYYKNIDAVSPTYKMQEYFDNYIDEFYVNVLIGLAKQVYRKRGD